MRINASQGSGTCIFTLRHRRSEKIGEIKLFITKLLITKKKITRNTSKAHANPIIYIHDKKNNFFVTGARVAPELIFLGEVV